MRNWNSRKEGQATAYLSQPQQRRRRCLPRRRKGSGAERKWSGRRDQKSLFSQRKRASGDCFRASRKEKREGTQSVELEGDADAQMVQCKFVRGKTRRAAQGKKEKNTAGRRGFERPEVEIRKALVRGGARSRGKGRYIIVGCPPGGSTGNVMEKVRSL